MDNNKVNPPTIGIPSKESEDKALHYFKTLVEVARESFLILDSQLRVISANPVFYQNFKVKPEQTENILLYDLGNGQWNIPELKKLLEEILPDKKDVRDYEVKHIFQTIGEKTILLNARQIDTSQIIILAMEDISARKEIEESLAATAAEKEEIRKKLEVTAEELATLAVEKEDVRTKLATTAEELNKYTSGLEVKVIERTTKLEEKVKQLENMNNMMVGRELKMVELKTEIEDLKKSQ